MSATPGYGKISESKVSGLRHYDRIIIDKDGNIHTNMLITNSINPISPDPLTITGDLVVTGSSSYDILNGNIILAQQTIVAGNNLVVGGPSIFYGNVAAMCNMYVGKDLGVAGELTVEGTLRDETARRLFSKHKDASVSLYIDDTSSVCSGSFISQDGYILTAAHCCSPDTPDNIFSNIYALVTNYDGNGTSRVVECDFIGMDGAGDVGVLKVDGLTNQSYLNWGDSTEIRTGDHCFVLGNPLGIDHQSITDGLVRDATYVQTETPTFVVESIWTETLGYGGNSGSPIIDLTGNIIGLYTFGKGDFEGLGGGTTQRIAEPVVDKIIETQDNYYLYRGQLGVVTKPVELSDIAGTTLMTGGFNFRGILILSIQPGGGADLVGIQVDDIIVSVDGIVCGILDGQTSHTTGYWHKAAGSTVEVEYIRPSVSLTPVVVMATLGPAILATDAPFSGVS